MCVVVRDLVVFGVLTDMILNSKIDPAELEALDPEQRQVAEALRGPVRVLAGAGTGKTRAITHRIAYGVATGLYQPSEVLAVTFTTRAAGDIQGELGISANQMGLIMGAFWLAYALFDAILLRGAVFVEEGAVLNVQAGTRVVGEAVVAGRRLARPPHAYEVGRQAAAGGGIAGLTARAGHRSAEVGALPHFPATGAVGVPEAAAGRSADAAVGAHPVREPELSGLRV